jgi:hypothetical protein
MAKPSDSNARKGSGAKPVAAETRDAGDEHIQIESPEETRRAIARIKAHFVDVERTIRQERKNPNAVALGRLGGLKSGKVRRSRSAAKKKKSRKDPKGRLMPLSQSAG